MFCGKCGTQIPEGAAICPNCGTNVTEESGVSNQMEASEPSTMEYVTSVENSQKSDCSATPSNSMNAVPFNNGETASEVKSGKGLAVAGMVLGIVSIVFWFFGAGALVGLVTGIIGLICSSSAKKAGYIGGMQTAGFVCSLIGLIGSALVFVACVACLGAVGTAGALGSF